ncbi:hypothetical protein PISMIDRAFT_103351 [Pisolithus microcarpus 441]|uniref:IRG-type G domain-containing protein n=1 Tax=Pisolithus microcarpus 441 TaxID=765257 RepID=A0A0C9YYK4_9AGAM|nr:hypothetical protein PISMIDRAFT_103351 [Pisolithus microcarpus 441]
MCFTEEIKPDVPNQNIADIEARAKAEKQQAEAERREKEAKEELERIQRAAEEERQRAQALQEVANRAAEKAREEMERAEEEARRVEAATREEAQRVLQAAEEERQRAKLAQTEAEKAMAVAAEEARRAVAAKEEAESRLKKGIRPVVTPSLDELERAKERIQYREGFFHFAVTGVAGSGKSSLVNAFRGLRNKDAGAAATGVTETTLETAMYPDPSPNHQLLWFDIPGAGTLKVPDWQYFNEHGLYVFDCIIVLFDARFTLTDIAILSNARRFNIPAYIVRSKADQHIRNIMRDMGYNSDDDDEEDDPGRRNRFYKAARKQYIEETRKSIKANLENANLPDEQVYLVSNDTMLSCVTTQKPPKKVIDEIELLTDIYTQVVSRRTERKAREAAELARRVQAEREELERQLRRGIQPVVRPTLEEIRLAKAKVQYDDAMFHFAVAGIAGSGKSSLINALCGMNNSDPNAAPTGVNETTMEISRYVDTTHPEQFAWYDVPGSGTLGTPDWQYFNSQGLYVFDCVLVLVNNRFTVTDQAILRNCHHFQIPTFIVRSKSDQHILNLMMDMGFDSDMEDTDSREQFFNIARERYISGTRQSVKDNLATANLPDQRVYIVSKKTLFSAAQNRQPMGMIDEVELLTDLYSVAYRSGRFA